MIGKLQGIVDFIGDNYIILMAGGVGYRVFVPAGSGMVLGDKITLWIETHVREDHIHLYGFKSLSGQDLFNKLLSVSGVGPKMSMAILGAFKTDVLMSAIATGDIKTLTAVSGVGKKVAEKIILELKGKVSDFMGTGMENSERSDGYQDTLSALESLGYRRTDIVELVQNLVNDNPDFGVEKLVPIALKEISKK